MIDVVKALKELRFQHGGAMYNELTRLASELEAEARAPDPPPPEPAMVHDQYPEPPAEPPAEPKAA